MKSYSVKQIAEILNTNPETVRRWIRDKKLKAIQISRKDGNIVTEAELERFVKATPKYISRFTAGVGLATGSPFFGISALAGGIITGALLGYFEGKSSIDTKVRPEDFKDYLQKTIGKWNDIILQKQALIQQTESEITELRKQIEKYRFLLEHDDLLIDMLRKIIINMET